MARRAAARLADEDLVAAIEQHRFDPVAMLQWRNADLDFRFLEDLQASLQIVCPPSTGLTATRPAGRPIFSVLDIASHDEGVRKSATNRQRDIQPPVGRLPDS